MFLTNNSPDLCVLTLCVSSEKNNLYLASLPRISAISNENYTRYNFQALTNISGKFPQILNFWKIYNPTDCDLNLVMVHDWLMTRGKLGNTSHVLWSWNRLPHS